MIMGLNTFAENIGLGQSIQSNDETYPSKGSNTSWLAAFSPFPTMFSTVFWVI